MKYIIFYLITILFISCSSPDKGIESENKKVFNYNESSALTSLDPAFAGIQANTFAVSQLFNGLVDFDINLNIVPSIAREWELSADGKTYTFHLRKGVYFHDHEFFENGLGREVHASDFEYSFKRICDTTTGFNQGMWIFKDKVLKTWSNEISDTCFKAIDDYTFKIYLEGPSPHFLGVLAMNYASVIPKEISEHFGKEFRRNPIGTGPFKFVLWDEGEGLIFHKNEKYWKYDKEGFPLPYLDAVKVNFLTDKKQAYRAFLMGELDYITGIEPNSVDEIFNVDGTISKDFQKRYDVEKVPYLNTEYLGFQLDPKAKFYQGKENHPYLSKKFRQALNFSIDREKLIRYLRNNVGIPANNGMVPPAVPNYNSEKIEGYSYDPDKALRLFKQSGFQKSELSELSVSCTEEYKDLIEFITKQWEDVLGVSIRVDITGASVYYSLIKNGETGFFRASWLGDYPDAENYLTLFYSKNFAPNGPNKTHYSNIQFDKLYRKGINEIDVNKRNLLYQEADQVMMRSAPVIPMFYDEVIRLKQKNITNFPANAMNLLRLEAVIKE